jgi:NADPH:quinone reductase-like Zn-dependent oxidoreductase
MKSLRLVGADLVASDDPVPVPGDGEVLVRVHAAGITPTEVSWYPTSHNKDGSARTGAVPCHEFSGQRADTGEAVFGMNDWFADGALAEYCVTRPEWIALKPRRLGYAEAASVPIGALTAWQGLFDRAGLRAGERVLVHGGAGAVGIWAVQLARWRGAKVTATVSARNAEFVRELGAAQTIDYHAARFEDTARDMDVVFDTVGGDTLRRSWSVLKPGGRMVTIAASGEATSDERTKAAFFIVEPNGAQLAEIGRMMDAGLLRTVVDRVAGWDAAAAVFRGIAERSGRGKSR